MTRPEDVPGPGDVTGPQDMTGPEDETDPEDVVDEGHPDLLGSLRDELAGLGELLGGAGRSKTDPEEIKRALEKFWEERAPTLRAEASAITEQVRLQTIEELKSWREQLGAQRKVPEPTSGPGPGTAGLPTAPSGDSGRPSVPEGNGRAPEGNGKIAVAHLEPPAETLAARPVHDHRPVPGKPPAGSCDEPDVLLDVLLRVEPIELLVEGLTAHVSVEAELADLVKLSVGADARLDRLKLTIRGVEATALLKVRLEEVRIILDRALTVLGEHPEILEILAKSVIDVVREVGAVVGPIVTGVVDGVLKGVVVPRGGVTPPPGEDGSAMTQLTEELDGAVGEAMGPEGAMTQLTEELDGAVGEAMGPEGAMTQLTEEHDGAMTQLSEELDGAVPEAVVPGDVVTQLSTALSDAVRESMTQLSKELGFVFREAMTQLTDEIGDVVRDAVVEAGAFGTQAGGGGEQPGPVGGSGRSDG